MSKYIAAIDQGTTSTRCILFDQGGNIVAVDQKEHKQIYPRPGWVEPDAIEIWENTQRVARGTLDKSGKSVTEIAAIGITNQRETTLVWERANGRPIYNAIVWQDIRTDAICNELALNGGQDCLRAETGLPLATYFSGPKIKWILDNVAGAREKAEKGELLFGNMDTWIIWNMTGEHVTDVTNASRTLLMDLKTLNWDKVLAFLGLLRQTDTKNLPIGAGKDAAALKQTGDYTQSEIARMAECEKIYHLDDLLLRRTLLAYLGQLTRPLVEQMADWLDEALGWSNI